MPSNVAHKITRENKQLYVDSKKQQEDEVYKNTHRPRKTRRNGWNNTCGEQISSASSRSIQIQVWKKIVDKKYQYWMNVM